jgi:hypothetical protein
MNGLAICGKFVAIKEKKKKVCLFVFRRYIFHLISKDVTGVSLPKTNIFTISSSDLILKCRM